MPTITTAIQEKPDMVRVYVDGKPLFLKKGTLQGFTGTTVTILNDKRAAGASIEVFNEQGTLVITKPYRK